MFPPSDPQTMFGLFQAGLPPAKSGPGFKTIHACTSNAQITRRASENDSDGATARWTETETKFRRKNASVESAQQ